MKQPAKQKPLTESAITVDAAHQKFVNARKNLANKKALFLKAEEENRIAWGNYVTLKDKHEEIIREQRGS